MTTLRFDNSRKARHWLQITIFHAQSACDLGTPPKFRHISYSKIVGTIMQ